jgi:hypothetical protein
MFSFLVFLFVCTYIAVLISVIPESHTELESNFGEIQIDSAEGFKHLISTNGLQNVQDK